MEFIKGCFGIWVGVIAVTAVALFVASFFTGPNQWGGGLFALTMTGFFSVPIIIFSAIPLYLFMKVIRQNSAFAYTLTGALGSVILNVVSMALLNDSPYPDNFGGFGGVITTFLPGITGGLGAFAFWFAGIRKPKDKTLVSARTQTANHAGTPDL